MAGMNDEGRQWYAISAFQGHENKVKEDLTKRIESYNLQDCLFQIIIPEVEEIETKNGKTAKIKTNLFPGYILVEMIMTDEAWFIVRNTPGVTGFIGSSGGGAKPFPIIQEEINPILKRMGIKPDVINVDYSVGDEVEIIDGAFVGQKGTVDAIDMVKKEAKIKYMMFNQTSSITVDLTSLKKIID